MNSYLKAIKKIKNKDLISKLSLVISNLEKSKSLSEIDHVKKLTGYLNCYRIKIDHYGIGLTIENNCVYLVEFLHRKDIYKKFP